MHRPFLILFLTIGSIMLQAQTKKFLALGDSYTIGEAVDEDRRWPVQLAAALRQQGLDYADPKIIATTGWRTDDLKEAIEKENPAHDYDLVSLLIGVNNQYQHKPIDIYKKEFEELLRLAITLAGNEKRNVFVVSIPDYGYTEFGEAKLKEISKEIDMYNDINRTIAKKLGVKYFNITHISRDGLKRRELVASDGLHPSGKMYAEWVELFLKDREFFKLPKASKR